MTPYNYDYGCVFLQKVTDGDTAVLTIRKTFRVDIDLGFRVKGQAETSLETTTPFRLYGINAPELIGATREAGLAAKAELARLLVWPARATTYKAEKYGRWLVDLWVRSPEGEIWVNQQLLTGGFAKPYLP